MPTQLYLENFKHHPRKPVKFSNATKFHLFPKLPTELRLKIWRYAFQRQRIVNLTLQAGKEEATTGKATWIWGDLHSTGTQSYGIFVAGFQLMNKFLWVCQEARAEVLKVYRVHIPCQLTTNPLDFGELVELDKTKKGTFYFSPEYDFLQIHSMMAPLTMPDMFFIDFISRLKTLWDPQKVGVLKLALNSTILGRFTTIHGSEHTPKAFTQSIEQLQEVYFIRRQAFGRVNLGVISGTSSTDIFITRSFPIMTLIPNFELLGQDPRPISEDLKRLNLNDPRPDFSRWLSLLKAWSIRLSYHTIYKFLIAFEATPVYNHATAKEYLEREDRHWRNPEIGKGATVELEDLDTAVRPALGFWLFQLNAFGPFQKNGDPVLNPKEINGREYKDLTKFYPELALSVVR